MIIYLVVLMYGLSCYNAKGQLREYDEYKNSCKAYYNKLWTAERTEFVNIQKGKNWNLIPNVGMTFGLPSINFNTGQIANLKERQSLVKAKLKSIDLKYELLFNEELNKIRIEMEKYKNELDKLGHYVKLLETKKVIFGIHREAYEKREMKPLDFYKEKLAYEVALEEMEVKKRNLAISLLEIEKLARYDMRKEVVYYEDADCIMLSPEFSDR